MYFKIFLVQILYTTAVFCRTSQDVINDFEPVFEARHNEFRYIQNSFKVDATLYFQAFASITLDLKNALLLTLREADEKVNTETTKYLEDTGMINKPEKILHCMNDLKTNITNIHSSANGGGRVCEKVVSNNITKIMDFYNDIQTKLENEHKIIEVTREECVKLTDPFEVQTCVINDLYTFYLPYIADVKSAMKIYLQDIANGITSGINQNKDCFDIVKEFAKSDAENTVSDFKICVWFEI